jgi:hypothetical protein
MKAESQSGSSEGVGSNRLQLSFVFPIITVFVVYMRLGICIYVSIFFLASCLD